MRAAAATLLGVWAVAAPAPTAQGTQVAMVASPADAGASSSVDDVLEHLARGEELHRSFAYAEAAREFEEAHRLVPDSFAPLEWLSHVYNDLGHGATGKQAGAFYGKAAAYAETLRRRFPERPEGHFWVAASSGNLALFKGGRDKVRLAQDVEASAKKAIALDPGFAPAYVALGIYYREVAELNWFLRAFAKVLYGGLPKGTRKESEAMLRKAVDLDSGDVLARYQLGLTLLGLDRDAEGAEQFRALLALPAAEAQDRVNQKDAEARLGRMKRK